MPAAKPKLNFVSKPDPQLKEIKEMLLRQQAAIDELRSAHVRAGFLGKSHWKLLLVLAALALIMGGVGAYQYYTVLQSVISQFPQ